MISIPPLGMIYQPDNLQLVYKVGDQPGKTYLSDTGDISDVSGSGVKSGVRASGCTWTSDNELAFSGSGNGFLVSGFPPQGLGNFRTYFFRFRITSLANAYTCLFVEGTLSTRLQFFITSAGKTAVYTNLSQWDGSGAITITTGSYHELCLSVGPAETFCMIDGVLDKSVAPVSNAPSGPLAIGYDQVTSGRRLTGRITDLEIFNQAVTQAFALSHYNNPFARYPELNEDLWTQYISLATYYSY